METNGPANLLLLCLNCHAWVESHRGSAQTSGLLVSQQENPADQPLWRRGEWVLLDDVGGMTRCPVIA